jgi:hypothetical protein
VPTLRLKPKISSMLTSRGGAPLRTVDMCHDGRVPLAGQELLAIVVLAQWIGIGRIASQSALLGPLFQCVGIMLSDVLKWLVLTVWPLIVRVRHVQSRRVPLLPIVTPLHPQEVTAPA